MKKHLHLRKKILSIILTAAFLLALLPSVAPAALAATTYNINSGSINIMSSGDYIFNGSGVTANSIAVTGGITVNVTLNNVQINALSDSYAFYINPGSTVNLTLLGNNTLTGGYDYAGLQVEEGATLNVYGPGSLTATGISYGAGIGGGHYNSGTINIMGGTVTASGGDVGAGIGGGRNGDNGPINISGGIVTANAGASGGAGIGGGLFGNCGSVNISGGTVTANGSENGAAIGGGYYRNGGTVTITGRGTHVIVNGIIGRGGEGATGGSLTVGSADMTAAPLPYLALTNTNASISFKNCMLEIAASAELTGPYNQDGYIQAPVDVTAPARVDVGEICVVTAALSGYSEGTVQFSYKADGDEAFTSFGSAVSVVSGTATTGFSPPASGNFIIQAQYTSWPIGCRKGSGTAAVTAKDAALASLGLSAGALNPAFNLLQKDYTVNVGYDIPNLTVTPTVHDAQSTVSVNSIEVTSGNPSGSIALPVNVPTDISVKVTAQDGTTTTTYKVTATRGLPVTDDKLASLAISAGTLNPAFSPDTTEYTADVGYYVASVTVTPTVREAHATITVNGTPVTSGNLSASIPLTAGAATDIVVTVTAQDGIAVTTYKVTVNRASAAADSALAGLGISAGTLSPAFAPNVTNYTVNVGYDTRSVNVTPTVDYPGATVTVNGAAVTSGQASAAIALTEGVPAAVNVVVTALDGVTTTTYTINVTRAFSAVSSLAGLSISTGTLSPAFASGTTFYTVNVYSSVPSVTVTPAVNDDPATITVNGAPVASGASSADIALTPGTSTNISIVVTAQNGTKTTYTVRVADISPTQAIDANSLQNLKAPTGVNQYQHVYYGGVYWRVLINSGTQLFLLTDDVVATMAFRSDFRQNNSNQYSASDARAWLLGTFLNRFSAPEQSAMAGNSYCYNDKVFLLTDEDARYPTYFPGIGGYYGLFCDSRSASADWWTRTSHGKDEYGNSDQVGYMTASGYDMSAYGGTSCYMPYGIRPGMLLNLSAVLHASPAADGGTAAVRDTLSPAQPVTDNVKLTLKDAALTLTVDGVSAESRLSGSTITVNYSGASTGAGRYLCVNISYATESYSGVIKALTAGSESGTAIFTLPADVTPGQYTLCFWNEQYNAPECTNYASAAAGATITLNSPVITQDALPEGTIGALYETTAAATGGTAPYVWSATGLPIGLSIDADGKISGTPEPDGTHSITEPYSVTLTVTDADGKTDMWDTSLKINPASVALVSAAADGTADSVTSTQIDIIFDKAVPGLSADNIAITNETGAAVKGTLTGSGTHWTIGLAAVTAQGDVSVSVSAPAGYTISGCPKTVAVYKDVRIVDAAVIPVAGSFDKKITSQADVQATIAWGSASRITDVNSGGISIGAGNYTVSGNVLTIRKEYLAAQAIGNLPLTVEFDAGSAVTLTIAVTDTTPPVISPTMRYYDLNTPVDVTTAITWNSASAVTGVACGSESLSSPLAYTVSDSVVIFKVVYLSGLPLTVGDTLEFNITFDTGAVAALTVHIANGYVPNNNADLSGLSVNGMPVGGFDPGITEYNVALPYGSTGAAVTATTADPNAVYTVTPASSLPGSATVTVTAEDGTTKTYIINFTIEAPPAFVPVTDIAGVPTAATAGVNLTLSGTVDPIDATNQAILWRVLSAGTTGAAVSGNTLSTAAAGIVTLRATITNGLTPSTDYTQDFTITVSEAPIITCTVTFSNNGLVYAIITVNAGQSVGSAAWPSDPERESYAFGGWFTGENGTGTRFVATIPVNATTTVYAKWTYSGDGGGSTPPPEYRADVKADNGTETTLPVTVDEAARRASIDISALGLTQGGAVITIPSIPGVGTYSAGIPVLSLSTAGEQSALLLNTAYGSMTIPSNMLTGVKLSDGSPGIGGSKAVISIGQGDRSALPDGLKTAIGDKPYIRLTLTVDGKQTDWYNTDAPVTVSIRYTPTAAELENPESIVIWYIDGTGNAVTIPNGHYDPATGTVTFRTTHFSDYAVAFNVVHFNDVPADAWYGKAVGFIAARGITDGTGDGSYNPAAKLTRGEFILLMMRAYGIAPDTGPTDNFSDAGSTYYTGYLAAAKRLGISMGIGNNMFAPVKEITRQEMFTMLYNALKILGQLPRGEKLPDGSFGKALSDFNDAGEIDLWAKEAVILLFETGIIGGSGGALSPHNTTTRAEMAQVLYNLLKRNA